MNYLDEIGECALLENLAEECCELAQAALKLSRIKRKENPTPKTEKEAVLDLVEEIADVQLMLESYLPYKHWQPGIAVVKEKKRKRWERRIEELAYTE